MSTDAIKPSLRERFAALLRQRSEAGDARREGRPIPVRDWINVGQASTPARLLGFDQALVTVVIALLALGIVMVYSATVALPDSPKFARYAPTYFMSRQRKSPATNFFV